MDKTWEESENYARAYDLAQVWLGSWKHILATPRKGETDNQVSLQFAFCLLYWCFCWFHAWDRHLNAGSSLTRLVTVVPWVLSRHPLSWETLPTFSPHLLNSQGSLVYSLLLLDPYPLGWQGHWVCLWKVTGLNHSIHGYVCWEEGWISKFWPCHFPWY